MVGFRPLTIAGPCRIGSTGGLYAVVRGAHHGCSQNDGVTIWQCMECLMSDVEKNLARLGVTIPPVPRPVAAYLPYVQIGMQAGSLVFVSGQLPSRDGKVLFQGHVPTVQSVEQGRDAARLAAINAVAVLYDACLKDWNRLERIVKLTVYVACEPDFHNQPLVANGASDLLVEIFGEAGRHARAAVGTNALPLGSTVEVEIVASVKPA